MGRNIVLCADGTGNTFDESVSNVTRLIKLLAMDERHAQVVVYDQGIGTNARRLAAVRSYREAIPDSDALVVLDGPREWRFKPVGWPARLAGLVGGYGLKANVRELYCELGRLYDGLADQVFLFGFSRGAFTVRALAGSCTGAGCRRRTWPTLRNFSKQPGGSTSLTVKMNKKSRLFGGGTAHSGSAASTSSACGIP